MLNRNVCPDFTPLSPNELSGEEIRFFAEAAAEYERCACTPLGRLIAQRELPILRRAGEILGE